MNESPAQPDEGRLPPILTLPELAKYLGVHPVTIHRMIKRGELTGFRMGSLSNTNGRGRQDWRFRRETIEQWMHAREQAARQIPKGGSRNGR